MSTAALAETRWICLPAAPESSGRCRQFLGAVFDQWGLVIGLDDAKLLLSELCSNVIRHAGTSMVVGVRWTPVDQSVRVSVCDGSSSMPEVHDRSDDAPSGRGLRIVGGVARKWGAHRIAAGKMVWFELDVGAPSGTSVRGLTGGPGGSRR